MDTELQELPNFPNTADGLKTIIWAPVNCGYDENHKYGAIMLQMPQYKYALLVFTEQGEQDCGAVQWRLGRVGGTLGAPPALLRA